jgi:hypothetical protein
MAVLALQRYGLWGQEGGVQQEVWRANGPAQMYGGNLDRLGRIVSAYNTLDDIAWMA